jgi:hypothetical protein
MDKTTGKIIVPPDVNLWPHEIKTAQALAGVGYSIEFIRSSTRNREHSADAYLDGIKFEFKSPKSSKMDAVERNLKRATKQSCNIVLDSRRIKRVPDAAIQRELSAQLSKSKVIKRILFVNRHGTVIDIS